MEKDSIVLTFFWADNFDINLESLTGHGGVHSTHMIAFQEESNVSMLFQTKVKFERTKKCRITEDTKISGDVKINSKREPPALANYIKNPENGTILTSQYHNLTWMIMRD